MNIFRLGRQYSRWIRAHAPLIYLWGALAVLLTTVFCWSLLAAHVQRQNADQLVDGYLFENGRTAAGAIYPASHTQLLKWPLFALLHLCNFSVMAYDALTILLTLATVGALAYVLFRIVGKRPPQLGTLYLALAAMLILVPGQVAGGATAPLNMAMLTGRNIEYPIFIGIVVCFIRAGRARSWNFAAASLLLTVLIASDRLFVFLSLGGAAVLLTIGWWLSNRKLTTVAWRWILGSILAYLGAQVVLRLAGRFVGRIVADPAPYGFITDWHKVGPALSGTAHALALNLGLSMRSGGWAIALVAINIGIVCGMLLAARWLLARLHGTRQHTDSAITLATALLATTIAATAAYASLDQPYVQNARYLSMVLPSGFILLAVWLRGRYVYPRTALAAASSTLLAIVLGLYGLSHAAQSPLMLQLQVRNQHIAAAIAGHPVEYLVGDYWRVFPVRLLTKQSRQAVVPMHGCINPSQLLTSSTWRPDVRRHSFAYIASVTPLGGMRPCPEKQISFRYGPPSARVVIAGNSTHPQEVLLFYDNGAFSR
ncbi:MAG TPA: hypothetical protein VLI54_06535 [Bacillota bacterium]|nr:hypothetical protein [Bacillota bacterium]